LGWQPGFHRATLLVNDKNWAEWYSEPYTFSTFKIKAKILKLKTLQRIIRKFPAIQWNRQNVILFHETIPLKLH
jgi:hypothetical protein